MDFKRKDDSTPFKLDDDSGIYKDGERIWSRNGEYNFGHTQHTSNESRAINKSAVQKNAWAKKYTIRIILNLETRFYHLQNKEREHQWKEEWLMRKSNITRTGREKYSEEDWAGAVTKTGENSRELQY